MLCTNNVGFWQHVDNVVQGTYVPLYRLVGVASTFFLITHVIRRLRCCQHQKRHQHQSVKGGACVHLIQIDDTCMPFRVGMEHIARRYSTEAKLSKTLPPRLPWGGGGPRSRCEVLTWRPSVPFFSPEMPIDPSEARQIMREPAKMESCSSAGRQRPSWANREGRTRRTGKASNAVSFRG